MLPSRVRASLVRGGTSKGLFFRRDDLPPPGSARDAILLRAIGPDPTAMQLDGVGGGVSSTSKVAIVGPSAQATCDLDYEFGQVSLTDQRVEHDQNCGNLASAVGLFALREGMVQSAGGGEPTTLRIWQVNTRTMMEATVRPPGCDRRISIPGVAGTAPPILLRWLAPGVGRRYGTPAELLAVSGMGEVEVTLVEAGNPAVIVRAADLGANVHGEGLDWVVVDELRAAAALRLGVELSSAMRVILVGAPTLYTASDGRRVAADECDLCASITTDGRRVHHAFTGTGSVNLAAAARVSGSVPHAVIKASRHSEQRDTTGVVIGHPGGSMEVLADVTACYDADGEQGWHTESAGLWRTARILFRGEVEM